MTRAEAEALIARILRDEIPLERTTHACESMGRRGYTMHDLRAILRVHTMESPPEWNEVCSDYRVSLTGKCLEGRRSRVILGLRQDGPCVLVTVMTVTAARRAGRRY